MNQRKAFDRGIIVGILIMIGMDAMYWFISSWRPDVSKTQSILVAIQAVVCFGGAIWLFRQRGRYSESE